MTRFIIGTLLLSANILTAQLAIDWSRSMGGSSFESTTAIIKAPDDKYIVLAYTTSDDWDDAQNIGKREIVTMKLDQLGNTEWVRSYGGSDNDTAHDIIPSAEGGFVVVGGSQSSDFDVSSNNGESDIYIFKVDDAGDVQWNVSVGDALWDDSQKVLQNTEGDYIVLARSQSPVSESDLLLIKLNKDGAILWQRSYGGSQTDSAVSIVQTNDGGYILISTSDSADIDISNNKGASDIWVLKIDSDGNKIWDRNYGGTQSDVATDAIRTDDGNVVIIGRTYSDDIDINTNKGVADCWIIKLDNQGAILWNKTYGGSELENPTQIAETSSGNLVVAGYSSSSDGDLSVNSGNNDFWVLELDSGGSLISSNTFGGADSDRLNGLLIVDDKLIVAGHSYSDDGDVASNNGLSDLWIAQLGLSTLTQEIDDLSPDMQIYPNPTNGAAYIKMPSAPFKLVVSIHDVDGRAVVPAKEIENQLHIEKLPVGTYIVTMQSEDMRYVQKIVKTD